VKNAKYELEREYADDEGGFISMVGSPFTNDDTPSSLLCDVLGYRVQ
jgi:hypothetical protein